MAVVLRSECKVVSRVSETDESGLLTKVNFRKVQIVQLGSNFRGKLLDVSLKEDIFA